MKPYLSVIIPAYNEEDNLNKGALSLVTDYLARQKFTSEIIVINDGSSDNTLSLLNQYAKSHPQVRIIDNLHMGKAAGIMTGVFASKGEIILFTDMDQATPIIEFDKFIPFFQNNQIVIGSRSGRKGAPLFRQILAYGQILLRTMILRLPFRDTQCGFKAFKNEAAIKIFTILKKIHPFKVVVGGAVNPGFDVEILYLGRKMRYKIAEVPVVWEYHESKRVGFARDAINGIRELLLVRFRSLANVYKIK